MATRKIHTIGIIGGGGIGNVLQGIVEQVIEQIAEMLERQVEFFRFENGRKIVSYHEVHQKHYGGSFHKQVMEEEEKDVKAVEKFIIELAEKGGKSCARLAYDAGRLYQQRQIFQVVKYGVTTMNTVHGARELLWLRDCMQGFYANTSNKKTEDGIELTCVFEQKYFDRIAKVLNDKIKNEQGNYDEVHYVYKYHVLGVEGEKMIRKSVEKYDRGHKVSVAQPDTGIDDLLQKIHKLDREKKVFVFANEIGDIVREVKAGIPRLFPKAGNKRTMITTNMWLVNGNDVYVDQTVHGSADRANPKCINPIAAIKLALSICERDFGVRDLVNQVDKSAEGLQLEEVGTEGMVAKIMQSIRKQVGAMKV